MEYKFKKRESKPLGQWPLVVAGAMAVGSGALSFYSLSQLRPTSQIAAPDLPKTAPAITAVGALGRIQPQGGEVTHLSVPNSLEGDRVGKLFVKKGDKVRAGQLIAILDRNASRLADLEQAQTKVEVAQARLAQVRAGAKTGDITAQKATIGSIKADLSGQIAAQQATIARLEDQLRNAQTDNRRYQQLYEQGAISASASDSKMLSVDTVREQINEAKATLNRTIETSQKQQSEAKGRLDSISEVRPTDVLAAKADVNSAKAAVKQAQANVELTYIRAPINGQILETHTRPGEIVDRDGIVDLGQTNQMYVVAEVYETDIEKVRIGQAVTVTGAAFSGELSGRVTEIGLQVDKQHIFNTNPMADTDHKVIQVKVRLDDPGSRRVAGLTDLQVQVLIHV